MYIMILFSLSFTLHTLHMWLYAKAIDPATLGREVMGVSRKGKGQEMHV